MSTTGVNSPSRCCYHTGIDHIGGCKLVMYAYAVTCLDNKLREENYHSCSACRANMGMAVFVCHWDLSVCSGRSLL